MSVRSIEQIISEEGIYVSTTCGISMLPLLKERRDTVVVSPLSERAKKYDVVLYKRGNEYVFHRVIKVLPDSYIICGDNCVALERGIKDSDIIGKMVSLYRGDKEVDLFGARYGLYCRFAVFMRPFRAAWRKTAGIACSVFRRIGGKGK